MSEDLLGTHGYTEISELAANAPLLKAEQALPSSVPPTEAEEKLAAQARSQASLWKLSAKRKGLGALRTKWLRAKESIEQAISELQDLPSDSSQLPEGAVWLVENVRLLRTALRDTRRSFRLIRRIGQLQTSGDPLPRAYVASDAFLQAVGYVFETRSLGVYFGAAQEHAPLEMNELWALGPLMSLVLLERVGEAAGHLREGPANPPTAKPDQLEDANAPLSSLVTSLRDIVNADWKDLFERLSETEHALGRDPSGTYQRMDWDSRNMYRETVRGLARRSRMGEVDVAAKALELANGVKSEPGLDPRAIQRRRHVGYYLIDKSRPLLERQIGYRPSFPRIVQNAVRQEPEFFYLVGILLVTLAIAAFVVNGLRADVPLLASVLLLLIPATQSAVGVMNQLVAFLLPPRRLPKLDFSRGIPADCMTMVVVPTLLLNEQQVRQMVRDLEIRYLGNVDAHLHFALLTDGPDSPRPADEPDTLVDLCSQLIEGLNQKYRAQTGGSFFHFHRHRVYNPSEGVWMGWERKRGKLLDFNNLLRGKYDSFPVKLGDLSILPEVKYVITLDSDTQLVRGSAHKLVGALAHPLNRAVIDPITNTVVEGYGILQPRVGTSIRSANRSRLASIYSGQSGFDIYTHAVSDVYQDLMGEGSFAGKGIYEVDVFQRVLSERFPLNAILSHDLIEGAYARAGLVTDIELIDDYPSHFSAYSRRKHRWVRGDWQIMRWLFPRVPDYRGNLVPNPISVMSRWKILDNLRRSLVESATFVLLLAGWFFLPGGPSHWTIAVLALLLIPTYLRLVLTLSTIGQAERLTGFLVETLDSFVAEQVNVFMFLALLVHQVLVNLDAIVRTVFRLAITRRRLLEWETAAESEAGVQRRTVVDLYLQWTPFASLAIGLFIAVQRPSTLWVASPVLTIWALSGVLSHWLSRPLRLGRSELTWRDRHLLRQAALRAWRFFRTFSQADCHWLIPDNFQEEPQDVAQRISPTNLGLLLNARLAAYEFGYLSLGEFIEQTEKSLDTTARLPRHCGHLFNWYDTRTLQPLEPFFISTVDSGNLACCLWTLKQGCLQIAERPIWRAGVWQGIKDHLALVAELADELPFRPPWADILEELKATRRRPAENIEAWIQTLPRLEETLWRLRKRLAETAKPETSDLEWWVEETCLRLANLRQTAEALTPWLLPELQDGPGYRELGLLGDADRLSLASLPGFARALDARLNLRSQDQRNQAVAGAAGSIQARLPDAIREAESFRSRLLALAKAADDMVRAMDFRWLYSPERRLLSIGYNVPRHQMEKTCYDLLASEARSAAFVAVAKNDVPQESWLLLGRTLTQWRGRRVLQSWSGTMFEYLMPTLWMGTYPNTIFDQTFRGVVACQRKLTERRQIPWGVSEAACSRRNTSGHYEYFAFGVRALALRARTFSNLVVAPYATFLALAVDAAQAVRNLRTMKEAGWVGRFGYFEAADFTAPGVQGPKGCELVRCWMAHHQGMILLSICNLLAGSAIQRLFHAEPSVAATERLLHERAPRASQFTDTPISGIMANGRV